MKQVALSSFLIQLSCLYSYLNLFTNAKNGYLYVVNKVILRELKGKSTQCSMEVYRRQKGQIC